MREELRSKKDCTNQTMTKKKEWRKKQLKERLSKISTWKELPHMSVLEKKGLELGIFPTLFCKRSKR